MEGSRLFGWTAGFLFLEFGQQIHKYTNFETNPRLKMRFSRGVVVVHADVFFDKMIGLIVKTQKLFYGLDAIAARLAFGLNEIYCFQTSTNGLEVVVDSD